MVVSTTIRKSVSNELLFDPQTSVAPVENVGDKDFSTESYEDSDSSYSDTDSETEMDQTRWLNYFNFLRAPVVPKIPCLSEINISQVINYSSKFMASVYIFNNYTTVDLNCIASTIMAYQYGEIILPTILVSKSLPLIRDFILEKL